MDVNGGSPTAKKAKNGKFKFTPEIEAQILDACGSGFTIEKAGALVGVNPSTIRTWIQRMPKFGEKVETARKNHELSLLKSIELAGEKSWQAKAWLAERIYHHAVPSSRLSVDTNITHNAGQGFAQLIAGLASRRAEKKAQVIECQDVRAIEDAKKVSSKLNKETLYNTYSATLATNPSEHKSLPINNNQNHTKLSYATSPKLRNKPMRRRKPRAESLAKYPPPTTTPPATPPAAIFTRNTPLSNSDTKQKEDYAQEATKGSAEVS